MKKQYYVYIMRNNQGTFYIGVTNNLERRIYEHKQKLVEGFTKKYNIDKLIYYEVFSDPINAVEREKQLKTWNRKKKIVLITKMNPKFKELQIIP